MEKIFLPAERYPTPTVTALGFFDGVHLAHAALLRQTVEMAKQKGCRPAVFTFLDAPHKEGKKLFSKQERLEQFEACGIETVFLAEFEALRSLSPEQFIQTVLEDICHTKAAVCGYNFRFGKDAAGDAALLKQHLPESYILPPYKHGGELISSTRIRTLIEDGKVEEAAQLLGAPYTVKGSVLHGKALGRTLGFPTANMMPQELLPKNGVYETRAFIDGSVYAALTDIGTRPTVEGKGERRMETYILDFDGDLYGKELSVTFLRCLREEIRFASADDLKAQLKKDLAKIEKEGR